MNKQIIAIAFATLATVACNNTQQKTVTEKTTAETANNTVEKINNNISSSSSKSSFIIDGAMFFGDVSIEDFDEKRESSNFTISCHQNEPSALLQLNFFSKKDVTSKPTHEPQENHITVWAGMYNITYRIGDMGYSTHDKSKGSITATSNLITLVDVELFNDKGEIKKINGTVNF